MRPHAYFLGFLVLATLGLGWALDTALSLRAGGVTVGGVAAGVAGLSLLVVSLLVLLRIVGRAAAVRKAMRRPGVSR